MLESISSSRRVQPEQDHNFLKIINLLLFFTVFIDLICLFGE